MSNLSSLSNYGLLEGGLEGCDGYIKPPGLSGPSTAAYEERFLARKSVF